MDVKNKEWLIVREINQTLDYAMLFRKKRIILFPLGQRFICSILTYLNQMCLGNYYFHFSYTFSFLSPFQ